MGTAISCTKCSQAAGLSCMQSMFRYIPCRFIPHLAGCAGNRVHPDIFNATSTMDPVALAMSQMGLPTSSQTVLPSGLSSVGPQGNVHPGTVSIPGWSSVPPHLVRKILSLEFVDVWELLPESWRLDQSEGSCFHARRLRRGQVTNFLLWTECFATLIAVLATRYLERHPILWRTSTRLLEPAVTLKEWLGHPTTWHIGGKLPISAP